MLLIAGVLLFGGTGTGSQLVFFEGEFELGDPIEMELSDDTDMELPDDTEMELPDDNEMELC